MESLSQNAPAIIEQAAKSPLGVTALVVLALSILAAFLFGKASEKVRLVTFTLTLISLVILALVVIRTWTNQPATKISLEEAGQKAERFVSAILRGGISHSEIAIPFCTVDFIKERKFFNRTEVIRHFKKPDTYDLNELGISIRDIKTLSDIPDDKIINCGEQFFSPDDYLVTLTVSTKDNVDRIHAAVARDSGLIKAAF